MRVLVVFGHPRHDSFNAAVLEALTRGLEDSGHEVDAADLHAEGFSPALTPEDLAAARGDGRTPSDVIAYQERILAAGGLAFLFPVWWFAPPAMIKGWIDRVFQEHFAFRFLEDGRVEGLLHHDRALVLATTGAGALTYRTFGFARPMKKTLCDWTLKMSGVSKVRTVLLHRVVKADDATRHSYLEEARRLGRRYFGVEVRSS